MAVRAEDLSGPRNLTLLKTLNRITWGPVSSLGKNPDDQLTKDEAKILKQEAGIVYNGPYKTEACPHTSNFQEQHTRPTLIYENTSKSIEQKQDSIKQPTLVDTLMLPQKNIDSSVYETERDYGKFDSDGNPL